MNSSQNEFIRVNKVIGKQPSLGPIPANQLIPWVAIATITYAITNGLFSLSLGWFFGIDLWLTISWWALTGKSPHQFIDRFSNPPGANWYDARKKYVSPLKPTKTNQKLPPLIASNPEGGTSRFMPFQNETDICCLIEIVKNDREVAGLLLKKGDGYQIIFGFQLQGLHNLLQKNEIAGFERSIAEGMKKLPPGEKLTLCTSSTSNDEDRINELEALANSTNLKPISVLNRSEQLRTKQLTTEGKRQIWTQTAFCSWTANTQGEQKTNDLIGKCINQTKQWVLWAMETISDNHRQQKEHFFSKMLLKAFDSGFIQWELLLARVMNLNVKQMTSTEIWYWVWRQMNRGPAPPIPQIIRLTVKADGTNELKEIKTTQKHTCTVLIEGHRNDSACPEHRKQYDRIYLPGLKKHCGVLTMYDSPAGWENSEQQLKWLYGVMSSPYVHDTECWAEITTTNNFIINDNLARQAKQSYTNSKVAVTKGQGRDIGAEMKQEESFEAQKALFKGQTAVQCAVVFLVYRDDPKQLNSACNILSNSCHGAKVLRERNIAWELWLQCSPLTTKYLLSSGSLLSDERRQTHYSSTVAGILPLTVPKSLDQTGVEFLSHPGGKPLFIDLFNCRTGRCLIIGESGSGKTALGWRLCTDALSQNIPVIGMDTSVSGDSPFKSAIELLGDQGAYCDMFNSSSNLVEPPDLRNFNAKEREKRQRIWQDSLRLGIYAISMGKIDQPHLAQRVDAILLRTINAFLEDQEIIARYNNAFKHGWKSAEWQQIPVYKDLLGFCSKERLNLESFSELDEQAINQIKSQGHALLRSNLGRAIGRPSTFSPEPAIKFFALNNISNEQDAYLMAINAHAACIRNTLSHPKSLFIGDELSIILKKPGYANMLGEMSASGRRSGMAMVLLSQDLDAISSCSASAQILQNMTYKIVGRLTESGVKSCEERLNYDPKIIGMNATDEFIPKASDLSSSWLIEKGGRFWSAQFYPSRLLLSSIANNQWEQRTKNFFISKYSPTTKGRLKGLKEFSDRHIPALQEGRTIELESLTRELTNTK